MAEETKQVVVERESHSHVGTIVAIVLAVVIVILLAVYGLPYINGSNNSTTNVNIPAPSAENVTGN